MVVIIEPSSICNQSCWFCPTGQSMGIKELMTWEAFGKVLESLKQFKSPIKVIRLYKNGEPLLNGLLEKMIIALKDSNVANRIEITTNGTLFTPCRNKSILEAGVDQVNISCNPISLANDEYFRNIEDLFIQRRNCKIRIKAIAECLGAGEKDYFFKKFTPVSDEILLEHLQPNWPGFDVEYPFETVDVGHRGQDICEREVCPYIFYCMVINANGTVSACVQDWNRKLIMGDVKNTSLVDIWNSSTFNNIRKVHLRKERKHQLVCHECGVLKYGSLDNIDQYADELIEKF
jgi:radical SAM protein with 4Fe4S-binding SPASM domain